MTRERLARQCRRLIGAVALAFAVPALAEPALAEEKTPSALAADIAAAAGVPDGQIDVEMAIVVVKATADDGTVTRRVLSYGDPETADPSQDGYELQPSELTAALLDYCERVRLRRFDGVYTLLEHVCFLANRSTNPEVFWTHTDEFDQPVAVADLSTVFVKRSFAVVQGPTGLGERALKDFWTGFRRFKDKDGEIVGVRELKIASPVRAEDNFLPEALRGEGLGELKISPTNVPCKTPTLHTDTYGSYRTRWCDSSDQTGDKASREFRAFYPNGFAALVAIYEYRCASGQSLNDEPYMPQQVRGPVC